MKNFSDSELVEFADWAEVTEKDNTATVEARRAASAIRQGCDWMLRHRARERQQQIEQAGNVSVTQPQRKQ
jgi:hypothetical protein